MGAGDFDIHAKDGLNMKISQYASTGNVLITTTLPKNIKTAIMLEPFHAVFGDQGYEQSVIPTLLDKGYAVTRYTDSGASSEKFTDLNQYNFAFIDSHMTASSINVNHDEILDAFTLKEWYNSKKPPANSIVMLIGCGPLSWWEVDPDFFGGDYFTTLGQAFGKAGTTVGYTNTVDATWSKDSTTVLFSLLGSGLLGSKYTMKQAVDYVNNIKPAWDYEHPDAHSAKFKINGNGGVTL